MGMIPNIKQGDTFEYIATWAGAKVDELKSQIRNKDDELIDEVVIEDTDVPGQFRLSVSNTNEWTVGTLYTDIQRTADGVIKSTPTMNFNVTKDVTK